MTTATAAGGKKRRPSATRVPRGLRFRRVTLANWRNFRAVDVELQRRVILVGPNASGKSNFLDVFRFLRDLGRSGGGFQDAVASRGGVSRLRCLAARRYPEIGIEVDFSDGTLRLLGVLWSVRDGSGPLLLEEPELSLYPEVIRYFPQMLARVQRGAERQVILSTHSPELLRDEGLGLDEVLVLEPGNYGTTIALAAAFDDVRDLLEGGVDLADALLPRTSPASVEQLTRYGD